MLVAKVDVFLVAGQLPLVSGALPVHLSTVFLGRSRRDSTEVPSVPSSLSTVLLLLQAPGDREASAPSVCCCSAVITIIIIITATTSNFQVHEAPLSSSRFHDLKKKRKRKKKIFEGINFPRRNILETRELAACLAAAACTPTAPAAAAGRRRLPIY